MLVPPRPLLHVSPGPVPARPPARRVVHRTPRRAARGRRARLPIAHRERIPKSIRYTVDYILFNKLEVFINNQ